MKFYENSLPILSDWVKSKVQQGKYQQHFIKDKKKQEPPTVFGARDLIIKVKEQNPKEFPFQCKVTDYPHEKMLTYAFKDGLIPTPKDIPCFYLDFLATKGLDVRKQILEAYENMSDPGKAPLPDEIKDMLNSNSFEIKNFPGHDQNGAPTHYIITWDNNSL